MITVTCRASKMPPYYPMVSTGGQDITTPNANITPSSCYLAAVVGENSTKALAI